MKDPNRIIALIDGEHYLPVIAEALDALRSQGADVAAAVLVGGTEKIMENEDYSALGTVLLHGTDPDEMLRQALDAYDAGTVLDLSDEPVVGYEERFRFANIALDRGALYQGADFEFRPPSRADILRKPSMAIIGTGKRVGKTAVSAFICRILEKNTDLKPCVVAMGRGGPKEPDILFGREYKLDAHDLLEAGRAGKHAASDYYEDALLSRITTIGCRRCGGGLAGEPFISNVIAGAQAANEIDTGFVIMEGSGAAIPPVMTDGTILIVGAHQPLDYIGGYFGPYRIMRSNKVVMTMCEEPMADENKISALEMRIRKWNAEAEIVRTVFRPQPIEDISGAKVFLATTSPAIMLPVITEHLEARYSCRVVSVSPHLSNRALLQNDLETAGDCDLILTEIKAAAVDVVTEVGFEKGLRVVYMDNIPVTVSDGRLLEDIVVGFTNEIVKQYERQQR